MALRLLPLLLLASAAWAEAPSEPVAAPAPATSAPSEPSATEAGPRALRRARFETHRSVGFAVEAMMLGSLGLYIADDVDRFGGGMRSKSFTVPSLALSATAEVGMIVNLLLALTAPPRQGETPALTRIHSIIMYVAAAANVARFIIGAVLAGATAENADPGLVTAYRVTSIAAPVLFATGFTLKLF